MRFRHRPQRRCESKPNQTKSTASTATRIGICGVICSTPLTAQRIRESSVPTRLLQCLSVRHKLRALTRFHLYLAVLRRIRCRLNQFQKTRRRSSFLRSFRYVRAGRRSHPLLQAAAVQMQRCANGFRPYRLAASAASFHNAGGNRPLDGRRLRYSSDRCCKCSSSLARNVVSCMLAVAISATDPIRKPAPQSRSPTETSPNT